MISTGDANYDAILERAAEIREELRLTRRAPAQSPDAPPSVSVEMGGYRLSIAIEHIGQKAA